jgi:cytochrome c
MTSSRHQLAVLVLAAVLAIGSAAAAQLGRGASQGIYSAAQAARGRDAYAERCAVCHGANLAGLDVNPPLAGPRFLSNWSGQDVNALAARIRTSMPPDQPGTVSLAQSVELIAFLLQENRFPAGAGDLPASPSALRAIQFDTPPVDQP